jgi:putative ABC transport system permease protein
MFRATLKSALGHKLRLVLTTVSVVLGVSFIVGTLVLTDTINATFDRLFADANRNTAVNVRAHSDFTSNQNAGDQRAPVPASLLPKVRGVPGVTEAVGNVGGYAQVVSPKTKKVLGGRGAPGLGEAWTDSPLSPLRLTAGRGPKAAGEVAIDTNTAKDGSIAVGDTITVLLKGPPARVRVVGVFKFGSTGNLAGATITAFDPATAQRVLGTPGVYTSIDLAAAKGVSETQLRDRVRRVLPTGYEAITGEQLSAESSNSIKSALSFLNIFLLVFAGISLFVGSFIIFNTFTMLVAQRSKEMALLRALGASRRQVTRSVLGESLLVGLVASTVGLAGGLGVAKLLQLLFKAFGADIPASGLTVLPHTPVWAFVVGVGVTVAAAYQPARLAARIPPMAALRDDVALPVSSLRRRAIVGAVLVLIGIALLIAGLNGAGSQPAALVGLGAVAVFLGVAALSPYLSQPVVRLLGTPIARASYAGRLARDNALRNPRRTAATASALMVGLALVSTMTVMSSSIKESSNQIIDSSLGADFVLTTSSFSPFSRTVAERLRGAPGVAAVSSFRLGVAKIGGGTTQLTGTDPATVHRTVQLDMVAGSSDSMSTGALLVDAKTAKAKHWTVGERVPAVFGKTGSTTLTIGGIFKENQLIGSYLVSTATFDQHFTDALDSVVAVTASPNAKVAQVRKTVEAAAALSPNINVKDQAQFKADQRKQINQTLSFVLVLLALAVLIAALGIVNTLALSVFERTREIGLLRAVGMSRRQLRRMIRLESVIIAVFGAVLGVAVGVGFGWALVKALHDQGVQTLVIPWPSLGLYVVLAAVIGVLAAVLPARRAARQDVLQAIATT